MSHGGWYLDNQLYGNKFTSVSLHYNTIFTATTDYVTEANLLAGVTKNVDLAVTRKKSDVELYENSYTHLEWKRLGGENVKFYDAQGNKLGVIANAEAAKEFNEEYDEEGYSIRPLLNSLIQDDFNVAITNEYSDFGSDAGSFWNSFKTSIPTNRYMQNIYARMKANYDASEKDLKEKVNKSFIASALQSMNNMMAGSSGFINKMNKYQNANLMLQGSRFTFYNGTGISFGTLGLKITLFPKWENGKFKTVNAQLEEIYPYVVGNIEPVDGTMIEDGLNEIREMFKKDGKRKEFDPETKALMSTFMKFQMPPAGYEPGLQYLDAVNKGTLKLKIGPYYSISDLVIRDMQLNFSKYMVKNPMAGKAVGNDPGSIRGGLEADSLYSPLYCEVNIMLQPCSKFTSDKLKEFVSGAWRKSDIGYLNKTIRDGLRNEIKKSVNRYNPDEKVRSVRNKVDNMIKKVNTAVTNAIKSQEERKVVDNEKTEELRQKFQELTQEERDKIYNNLRPLLSEYLQAPGRSEEEVNAMVENIIENTDTNNLVGLVGSNEKVWTYEDDLFTSLAQSNPDKTAEEIFSSITSENKEESFSENSIITGAMKDAAANELVLLGKIDSKEHAIANYEYREEQKCLRELSDTSIEMMANALNATKLDNGSYIIDGEIFNTEEELKQKAIVTAYKDGADAKISYILKTQINTYESTQNSIAALSSAQDATANWEYKTAGQIIFDSESDNSKKTVNYQNTVATLQNNSALSEEEKATAIKNYLDTISVVDKVTIAATLRDKAEADHQETLNAEANLNSLKTQALNAAIKDGVITYDTLKKTGWVNNSGNFTTEFYNASIDDVVSQVTSADISKYTQADQKKQKEMWEDWKNNETYGTDVIKGEQDKLAEKQREENNYLDLEKLISDSLGVNEGLNFK